ncbi:MAG: DUF177 domain-containing protein [Desulfovibrionales bacterium]|nr:MAG: DUF177 domain-containing protein [Desulfovibrionales bacterium]
MTDMYIETTSLPVEGREFCFEDQRIWVDPINEFHLPYRIADPFSAVLRIVPHADGCTVEGSLRGSLAIPCGRCAEEFILSVETEFHEFEAFPDLASRSDDAWWIIAKDGLYYLDVAGFLWEQLQLAHPDKPLCSLLCRGICAQCGTNKNVGSCDCAPTTGDPRLAALHSLKLS